MKKARGTGKVNDGMVLKLLKAAHDARQLTRKQYRTLRGQVISGDAAAALRGLNTIQQRRAKEIREAAQEVSA